LFSACDQQRAELPDQQRAELPDQQRAELPDLGLATCAAFRGERL